MFFNFLIRKTHNAVHLCIVVTEQVAFLVSNMTTIGDYFSVKHYDTENSDLRKALEKEGYTLDQNISDVAVDAIFLEGLIDKLKNVYKI